MEGRPTAALVKQAHAIIDAAIEAEKPSQVFAMFSGGHDSLTATAITAEHPRFTAAVHVNTGIGIEATREFVRDTCRRRGWPLIEVGPPETLRDVYENTQTYEDIVLDMGFPGPAQHPMMYNRLKERAIRAFVREHKRDDKDRLLFSTGIRLGESVRRFRNYSEPQAAGFTRDGSRVWASPIQSFTKPECMDVIEHFGLERNAVVDLLHMSGECLCGAFAKPGEIHELEQWFPETAAYLHELEARAEEAGRIGCVWGRRPDAVNRDQMRLIPVLPLCTSCEYHAAKG